MSLMNQQSWNALGNEFAKLSQHALALIDGDIGDHKEDCKQLDYFRNELERFREGMKHHKAYQDGHPVCRHELFKQRFIYLYDLLDVFRVMHNFPLPVEDTPENPLDILCLIFDRTFGVEGVGSVPIDPEKILKFCMFLNKLRKLAEVCAVRGRWPSIATLKYK